MQQTGTAQVVPGPDEEQLHNDEGQVQLIAPPPEKRVVKPFPDITITSPFAATPVVSPVAAEPAPAEEPSSVSPLTQSHAATPPDASTGLNFHLPQDTASSAEATGHVAAPEPATLPDADPEATHPDSAVEAPLPSAEASEAADLQAAAVEALFAARTHNSAAEQLEETVWVLADGEVRIQTSLSKQMLSTIFRADVEAIVKGALRNKGIVGHKLVFLPGTREAKPATPKKPRTGSVQAKALEHPTVQAAQRLFNAEVTNVVDLRRD